MKRKTYQRPATKAVRLQHHGMLMQSGGGEGQQNVSPKATINNWQEGDETDDEVFM